MTTCANHNATPATAYCRTCGKPLCDVCKRDVHGVIYCEECIAARLQDAMPAGAPAPSATVPQAPPMRVADAPNVGLATFLGFIPGVGAMYNGQFVKGIAHIFIFAMLCHAADRGGDFFGILIPAFISYMVVDANKTAKAKLYGQALPDLLGLNSVLGQATESSAGTVFSSANTMIERAGQARNKPPIAAIILIGLGLLFLLDNLGALHLHWIGNFFFPILLIVLGVWLGYRRWDLSETAQVKSL
jgi:hypothetical protein